MLPIRASAYILSLVNEQVGKGAMSLYLYRRHGVPAWQAISCMLLLGLMEIYQLLFFSSLGVITGYHVVQAASTQMPWTSSCRRFSSAPPSTCRCISPTSAGTCCRGSACASSPWCARSVRPGPCTTC
jgi:hypothetical protein